MKIATKVIHVGNEPEQVTGAIMPPIYMTSTFVQDAPGEHSGFEYTRANNPNFVILEKLLASLENAEHATVFSSGLGALSAMITGLLTSGDHVVGVEGLYGGTYRLFNQVFNRFGIKFTNYRNLKSLNELERIFAQKPKWMLFETPTNPLLDVFDIAAMTQIAKKHGALSIVDNTFATPINQNPLDLGADVVWHSTTKYIGGHSDVIGGAIITNMAHVKERVDFARKASGFNPSPFDVWLVNRGVKTLAVRMKQHEINGMAVAKFLAKHPKVAKVYYPGLESHPTHAVAKKQMRGFGGMVSAEFKLPLDAAKKLISSFKLFSLAESLGGVESLVNHPATMTHASIPREERLSLGLSDGLVRFSVGIEDTGDLIADLDEALARF
jgi:cystathionine beta-lyase/cystathionine gamma-synthase